MLERYFVNPQTVDRIQASRIGSEIEQYVDWLAEREYSTSSVQARVPTDAKASSSQGSVLSALGGEAETCRRQTSYGRTDRESLGGDSPRHLMVLDVRSETCARSDRSIHDGVGVINKKLDPGARDAKPTRTILGNVARVDLMQIKRGAVDLQARHTSEVPQLGRIERVLVPSDGRLGIRDDQHHGDRRGLLVPVGHCSSSQSR